MFEPLSEDMMSYARASVKATPPVILALQAMKCIEDGVSTFLLMTMEKIVWSEEIWGILVVEDFPKVFADKVACLPPNKEMEFERELEPAVASTYKVLYHMTPAELKELKV